jgi:hypothetical protein
LLNRTPYSFELANPAPAALEAAMQKGLGRSQFRTLGASGELFSSLELIEPGLVQVPDWRPDRHTFSADHHPSLPWHDSRRPPTGGSRTFALGIGDHLGVSSFAELLSWSTPRGIRA